MKTFLLSFTGLLVTGNMLFAQNAHFTASGVVEYEKTANMFALIKKSITKDNEAFYQPFYDEYVKNKPQFKKLKSTLNFADNKTLFTPIEDEEGTGGFFNSLAMVVQNNTIFTDLQNHITTAQKKVYEETFLVKDTTRKIRWKITDETRTIAGFTCRRANAIVMDSIYVVAFYTDRIPVSGGPESFSGLPGMILGVALPHENITWFATKVTEMVVDPKALLPPKKGKPVDKKTFNATLQADMKSWGTYAQAELKALSL